MRVFERLRGGRFTVLSFDSAPMSASMHHFGARVNALRIAKATAATAGDLIDRNGDAARAYQVGRGLVLIRPDGYIASISRDWDVIAKSLASMAAAAPPALDPAQPPSTHRSF